MAIHNVIGDSFRGATWVAIHNGGGTGWGQAVNGGFGSVVPSVGCLCSAPTPQCLWLPRPSLSCAAHLRLPVSGRASASSWMAPWTRPGACSACCTGTFTTGYVGAGAVCRGPLARSVVIVCRLPASLQGPTVLVQICRRAWAGNDNAMYAMAREAAANRMVTYTVRHEVDKKLLDDTVTE